MEKSLVGQRIGEVGIDGGDEDEGGGVDAANAGGGVNNRLSGDRDCALELVLCPRVPSIPGGRRGGLVKTQKGNAGFLKQKR